MQGYHCRDFSWEREAFDGVGASELGEAIGAELQGFGEGMADGRQVRRVVVIFGERVSGELGRWGHVGSVGFEQDALGWQLPKDIDRAGFFRFEEIAGEGKLCAERN
jgi:hypothetical protein